MTPDHIAAAVYEALAETGQIVVLRRNTLGPSNSQIPFDVAVVATVRGYHPQELVGTIVQGDRMVVMSNREIIGRQWPGPPRVNDRVIIGDKSTSVMAVDTLVIGGTAVKHTLQVRG